MSSVSRAYNQRNNNITQIVPRFELITESGGPVDISSAYLYTLDLPNVPVAGGVYYVDLSGNDLSGNPINGDGLFTSNTTNIGIVLFSVNPPTSPAYYPGLEFTIFFRNAPINIHGDTPGFTIGMVSNSLPKIGVPVIIPYIMSPPAPQLLTGVKNSQSITFKCDGEDFNVTSSGPAGWLGFVAFSILLGGLVG
jgi:hypothetical protein